MHSFLDAVPQSMGETRFALDNMDLVFYLNHAFAPAPVDRKGNTFAHEHAWFEIHCVKKGCLKIKIDDTLYQIKANEVLFIPPRVYHITYESEVDTQVSTFGFEISDNGKSTKEKLFLTMAPAFMSATHGKIAGCRPVAELMQEITAYLRVVQDADCCRVRNMLTTFLFLLYDRLKPEEHGGANTSERETDDREDELRNYILDELTSQQNDMLTLEELSRRVYLNQKQINRIIKERYHVTFKQKQIRFRIENAKNQLLESDLPIDEIAVRVGYTNVTSFYKTFQKLVGVTPGEYRRQNRLEKE